MAGVFIPRGSDDKIWFFYKPDFHVDTYPSQYGRYLTFGNTELNGFTGGNGLFHYAPSMTPPLTVSGSRRDYDVEPIFVAAWNNPTQSVTVDVTSPAMVAEQGGTVSVAIDNSVDITVPVTSPAMAMLQGNESVTAVVTTNVTVDVTSPAIGIVQGNESVSTVTHTSVTVNVTGRAAAITQGSVLVTVGGVDTTLGDATNTGVPAGTTLTNVSAFSSTSNGQIIQNRNVDGTILINHNNVTIRRCRVTVGPDEFGINCYLRTGTIIEDCEIIGTPYSYCGIHGSGIIKRVKIHGFENALSVAGSDGKLLNSYLYDMQGPPTAHKDTIQIDGGIANWEIAYNTLENASFETSVVMIDNYWDFIDNIDVHDNVMLGGGGYTVYSDEHTASGGWSGAQITNVKFRNNRMVSGGWGYAAFTNNTPVFTNNRDYYTNAVITP
jgi:hypothetical protein